MHFENLICSPNSQIRGGEIEMTADMNNELEEIWKEAAVIKSGYPSILQKELSKSH
jgi:hypothetical protein